MAIGMDSKGLGQSRQEFLDDLEGPCFSPRRWRLLDGDIDLGGPVQANAWTLAHHTVVSTLPLRVSVPSVPSFVGDKGTICRFGNADWNATRSMHNA